MNTTFFNKIKFVLGILVVFALIVTTNLIDRDSFISVRNSMVTIYEDRLIVKDLIYDMFALVKEKELAAAVGNRDFFSDRNETVNTRLQDLIDQYGRTKLTDKEVRRFDSLKNNFERLWQMETPLASSGFADTAPYFRQIDLLETDLQELSDIQIAEGRRQLMISKQAVDTVELFTQIEIYILIILAIAIQIVIMYTPKEDSKS